MDWITTVNFLRRILDSLCCNTGRSPVPRAQVFPVEAGSAPETCIGIERALNEMPGFRNKSDGFDAICWVQIKFNAQGKRNLTH